MPTATEVRKPEVSEKVQPAVQPWRPPRSAPLARVESARPMFADSLLETDSLQRRRRGAAAVISFVLQCLLLGTLLIIPLMFTEALPSQQLLSFLVAPPPPPPPPPPAASAASKVVRQIESDMMDGRLRTPGKIPQKVAMIHEDDAPPALSSGGIVGGVPGGIPGGQVGGVIGGIISSVPSLSAVPKLAPASLPKRIRMSQGVTRGSLIHKVEPAYPPLARAARIQGQVILTAVISKTGEIQNLTLVSGHPMLVPAAIAAIQQWRYRPFLLNGEPVEVETTVTLTFELN